MRYIMKQKWLAFADSYIVRNDLDQEVYNIQGEMALIGHKLSFQDMSGRELAHIQQKVLSWGPTYEIYNSSQLVAVVKQKLFSFPTCKFIVDVEGPNDLEAAGDFFGHDYTFTRNGVQVASVSKEWFTFTDTYGVDVPNGESDILILAATAVIDMCCHERN